MHDSTDPDQADTFAVSSKIKMDYKAWNFTQENHYCRVDVDRASHSITVQPYDNEGNKITKGGWFGTKRENIESGIVLAPWQDERSDDERNHV